MKSKSAYTAAGVNIDEKMSGLRAIKKLVKSTSTPGVLSGIGPFGGMFKSPGKDKILVASTDGVGTKLKVATLCGIHTTIGEDIVNHCVNDILVQGAEPLFFLDYIASSVLSGKLIKDVVSGIARACKTNNCAILGGETAEMPGVYAPGEFDLVGTIVGVVDKSGVITGKKITRSDVIIGLPSSGLHTNGYSLARKAIFNDGKLRAASRIPGTSISVGKALLAPHKSYLKPIKALMKKVNIHGMAHITGGGFYDNIPRVLPKNVDAVINASAWKVPPIFRLIEKLGKVSREEMYRVFNMGMGYVVFVSRTDVKNALKLLKSNGCPARIIGNTEKGKGIARVNFNIT